MHMAGMKKPLARSAACHDFTSLAWGPRQRLFAKTCLPDLQRRRGDGRMQMGRNTNVDQVDLGIGEQLVQLAIGRHLLHVQLHRRGVTDIASRIR